SGATSPQCQIVEPETEIIAVSDNGCRNTLALIDIHNILMQIQSIRAVATRAVDKFYYHDSSRKMASKIIKS
ncbi:MAG: hypothetical protein KDK05_33710, partial [Candidatus Competibacteraceae bacterium]|nr:hypothetical protein [Candidatus Competibacteraceae bacterium]